MRTIILLGILGVLLLSGCQQAVEGNCILMENENNGELACFGCAGGLCTDPAPVMQAIEDAGGICVPTRDGCQLTEKQVPAVCTMEYSPVCGIDGQTYSNQCMAGNMKVAYQGECDSQTFCRDDEDCACGVHVETGECFAGNAEFVDTAEQCPDFCSGIAGNLQLKCVENHCIQS